MLVALSGCIIEEYERVWRWVIQPQIISQYFKEICNNISGNIENVLFVNEVVPAIAAL